MSLSLYVLRHGKADWGAEFSGDHERPLNELGRAAAALVGRFLRRIDEVPGLVLVSSALRARTTVEEASRAGEWSSEVVVEKALYGASPRLVIDVVRGHRATEQRVMTAGHEPWCSELITEFTLGRPPHFPPAGLARVDFELTGWDQLVPGRGALRWFVTPDVLQALDE